MGDAGIRSRDLCSVGDRRRCWLAPGAISGSGISRHGAAASTLSRASEGGLPLVAFDDRGGDASAMTMSLGIPKYGLGPIAAGGSRIRTIGPRVMYAFGIGSGRFTRASGKVGVMSTAAEN